jgi:hypothetical protein
VGAGWGAPASGGVVLGVAPKTSLDKFLPRQRFDADDESSGATPEFTREMRVLPVPVSELGLLGLLAVWICVGPFMLNPPPLLFQLNRTTDTTSPCSRAETAEFHEANCAKSRRANRSPKQSAKSRY